MSNDANIYENIQKIIDSQKPDIWTYDYTRQIINLATHSDPSAVETILSDLDSKTKNEQNYDISSELIFSEYYFLAHYYRLFNKTDDLIKLIDKYSNCFNTIPFNDEVKCWYYRRINDWDKAYIASKELTKKFDIQKNDGIYGNFISTILRMLEIEDESKKESNPIQLWESDALRMEDWTFCMNASNQILHKNDLAGKHIGIQYAKNGCLLTYKPSLQNESVETISKTFEKANTLFEKAITYTDETSSNYNKRCMEYRQMQARSHIRKLEILNNKNAEQIELQLQSLRATEQSMKDSIDQQLAKSLELLSIFTAVITLVTTSVSIIKGINFTDAVKLLLITATSWCLVYSIFVFMLYEGNRAKKSIIVAISLLFALFIELNFI